MLAWLFLACHLSVHPVGSEGSGNFITVTLSGLDINKVRYAMIVVMYSSPSIGLQVLSIVKSH